MKKYTYPIPLYFGKLSIIVATELNKHFREVDSPFTAITDAIIKDSLLNIHIGVMPDATPETVAHECVHAANMIFEFVGAKLDLENDEPYAYLVGWLVKKVHLSLKKYGS